MEPIKNVLGNMKPPSSAKIEESEKSWRAILARQDALRVLIIQLYASARKELPEDDVLDLEARAALDDLKEIPDADLAQAFRDAQVESGGFMATNGLIVKCYRESRAKGADEALKAIRMQNTAKYLAAPGNDLPTPEQRAENARIAAEIAARFADPAEIPPKQFTQKERS